MNAIGDFHYYRQHMSITSSFLVGVPTVGCGCAMHPLTG